MRKRKAIILSLVVLLFGASFNFEVKANSDTEAPRMSSLEIDKEEVGLGDTFTLRAQVADDISGVKSVSVYFRKSGTSGGLNNTESVSLKYVDNDVYEGSFTITEYIREGKWNLDYIYLSDVAGNSDIFYPNDKGYEFLEDVWFEHKPIDTSIDSLDIEYTRENTTMQNKVIDGDLYVGPESILYIDGPVVVTGDIYVLGAMVVRSNLTVGGTMYGQRFIHTTGYYPTLYNGTVNFRGGSHSIPSQVATTYPVKKLPLEIYETNKDEIIVIDGKLDITGATLPIVDLYVDDRIVNYNYYGAFKINEDVSDKHKINIKTKDIFGYVINHEYKLIHRSSDPNYIYVESVKIEEDSLEMLVDDTENLSINILPSNANNQNVIYESSNPKIVSVDSNGKLSALSKGFATVTVTSTEGVHKDSIEVEVIQPVESIEVVEKELKVNRSETVQINASVVPKTANNPSLSYSSSNEKIAKVDENGLVSGLDKGTAVITIIAEDNKIQETVEVRVLEPITYLEFDISSLYLYVDESYTLTPILTPDNADLPDLIWESSDIGVIEVNDKGEMKGLNEGISYVVIPQVNPTNNSTIKASLSINPDKGDGQTCFFRGQIKITS